MRLFHAFRFLITFVVASAGVNLQAQVLAPDKIVERLKASTVVISGLEGGGSGVVLSETGHILTNHHVVGAGIDLKVKLYMRFGDRIALTELDQVSLVKVHPKYDLAVLQAVAPAGATFVPVQMATKLDKISTGARCYVVGHPGGPDGKALELSITEGLVSSAKRSMDGLDYIQVSAAMNPGNSGGPVCNEYGRCIGIATWKMVQTEGIGFAIPTQNLVFTEFVELKDKPKNPVLAQQASEAGQRFLMASRQTTGAERAFLQQQALQAFRVMLEALPNDPAPMGNLAVAFSDIGEFDIARKYCEAALKLDPNASNCLHLLGVCLMQENPANESQATELWLRGAADTRDKGSASVCADNLAVTDLNKKRVSSAAYALQWADSINLRPSPDAPAHRQEMWEEIHKNMSAEDFALVRGLAPPFRRDIYERLVKGESLDIIKSAPPVPVAGGGAQTPAQSQPSGTHHLPTAEQMDQIAVQISARYVPGQQAIPANGAEFPLPDLVRNPVLGSAGWQLILPFKSLSKVGVFNLATLKFDGFIDMADPQAMCASGGSILAVYLPLTRTLEIYDLNTLAKRASQKVELKGDLAYIGMGLMNPRQITALWAEPPYPQGAGISKFLPALIRLPDFMISYPHAYTRTGTRAGLTTALTTQIEGGMDESGAVCAARRLGVSPTGYCAYSLTPDGQFVMDVDHINVETPRPSFSGEAVLSRNLVFQTGQTKDAFGSLRTEYPQCTLLTPIAGYAGFVSRVQNTSGGTSGFDGFRVYGLPKMNAMTDIKVEKDVHGEYSYRPNDENLTLLASVYSDRLVVLDTKAKKMRVHALGLKSTSSSTTSDVARAGKAFQRKIDLPTGASGVLENGPKGMTFDGSTKTLHWDVPKDVTSGQTIQAILLVTMQDGKKEYKIEKVVIP